MDNIIVNTLEGTEVNLSDKYRGKSLLILFYNNKCLGCTGRALPLAYKFSKEFKSVEVIAIHCNFTDEVVSKQDILDIFTEKTLPFQIYLDQGAKYFNYFQCEGTPHWILINNQGELYRSFFGSQDGAQNRLYFALTELAQ